MISEAVKPLINHPPRPLTIDYQYNIDFLNRANDVVKSFLSNEIKAHTLLLSAKECLDQPRLASTCPEVFKKLIQLDPKHQDVNAHDRAQRLFYLMYERVPASMQDIPNIGEMVFLDPTIQVETSAKKEAIQIAIDEIERDFRYLDPEKQATELLRLANACLENPALNDLLPDVIKRLKQIDPKRQNPNTHDRAQRLFYLMYDIAPEPMRSSPNFGERAFLDPFVNQGVKKEAIRRVLHEIEQDDQLFDPEKQSTEMLKLAYSILDNQIPIPLTDVVQKLKDINPQRKNPNAPDRAQRLFYLMYERLPESKRKIPNIGEQAFLDPKIDAALKKETIRIVLEEIERYKMPPIEAPPGDGDAGYRPDPEMCNPKTGVIATYSQTCNPMIQGCFFNPLNRVITFGTVYDNRADPARNHYADLVNALDSNYANKWGLQHEVIRDAKKFTEKQCTDPISKTKVDCELYYAKVRPFVEDCEKYLQSPPNDGVELWRIVKDDDMLTLRDDISPYDLIDRIRLNQDGTPNDASLILPTDSHPWPAHYMTKHKVDPRNRPNTGLIIGRIDAQACRIYRKWWDARNSIPDRYNAECRTLGICPGQNFGLHEQQGIVKVTADHPCLFDRLVTVIPVRDPKRTDIPGINSVFGHDKYCFQKCVSGGVNCNHPYGFPEKSDDPYVYQSGDLWTQPNAVPTHGKKTPRVNGRCPSQSDFATLPLEEPRLEVLKELCSQSALKHLCKAFFNIIKNQDKKNIPVPKAPIARLSGLDAWSERSPVSAGANRIPEGKAGR